MRPYFVIIPILYLFGCASTGKSYPQPETDVKYFHVKPYDPEPGVEYIRFTARIQGTLNIKNSCLLIGPHVPTFHVEVVIARDKKGLFIQHEKGGKKYRVGDKVDGGGAYRSTFVSKPEFVAFKNGAAPEICKPQKYRPRFFGKRETGSYVSFYLVKPDEENN